MCLYNRSKEKFTFSGQPVAVLVGSWRSLLVECSQGADAGKVYDALVHNIAAFLQAVGG